MFEWATWHDKLPDEHEEVCQRNLQLFFRTMYERQMIWKRRFMEHKSQPWTDDPILRDNKFTNVYRELDRNSQWEIKNIIRDDSLSLNNLIWKMMVFRFFNNPATFEFDAKHYKTAAQGDFFGDTYKSGLKQEVDPNKLISATKWRNGIPNYDEYDEDEFERFIAGIRSVGQNPYTNAYLINSMCAKGHSRDYAYTRVVIPTLHKEIPNIIKTVLTAKTPEDIIAKLNTLPSVSSFISHEFYQDFTYIPRYTDRKFMSFTQDDYTNVGPGASIGIRLIFPALKGKDQKQGIYRLRDMAEKRLDSIGESLKVPFPYLFWDKKNSSYYCDSTTCNITLHQIEMWLCEFQKYWKMIIGEGKQRSKFSPRTKEIINQ